MRRSRFSIASVVLMAISLAGAGLDSARGGAQERSQSNRHAPAGSGLVEAKDVRGANVTIAGEVYAVTPATRIFDEQGERITLERLPVARTFRDEARLDSDAIVSFEATETSHGWVLDVVRVQGTLPR